MNFNSGLLEDPFMATQNSFIKATHVYT